MSTLVRRPVLQVWIDGQQLRNVLSARVTRGLDQEYATGEIVIPYPIPVWIRQWQWTAIRMGASLEGATERLVGYVTGFSFELWPAACTIHVADPLVLCSRYWPTEDISLSGLDDALIIRAALNEVGFPPSLIGDIQGTGFVLTDGDLTWPLPESAMELIKEVDGMSLGFRTFAGLDGAIQRRYFDVTPSSAYVHIFVEGVDILSGNADFSPVEPQNEVTVQGNGDIQVTAIGSGAAAFRSTPAQPVNYPKVFFATPEATHLSATDIAQWLLGQLNRNLISCSLSTFRDDRIGLGQTARIESFRLPLDQRFWIQSVTTEVSTSGLFNQQLQLISELAQGSLAPGRVDPFEVGMPPIETTAPSNPALPDMPTPPVLGPTAGFSIVIDQELVVVEGVETTIYTCFCDDASTPLNAPIASYAWTAAGPGVGIASGSAPHFVTYFTDLAGATITLTVTDTLAQAGVSVRELSSGAGLVIKKRKLYAATTADWEVFDGNVWRSFTPGSPPAGIAVGPIMGAGDTAYVTDDDLASAPLTTTPASGDDVTAVWMEADANEQNQALGLASGQIAVSHDAGASWTVHPGPGSAANRIIISAAHAGELHLINAEGYWQSVDDGENWIQIRAGDFVDLVLSHSRNVVVTAAGGLERGEPPGEAFTFPGSPSILTATAHIREDRFYALAADGTSYVTSTDGGWAMGAAEPIPAGTPQLRGMYRDGDFVGLIYFAAGTGGLWKTIDGFETPEGFLMLREP